MPDNVVFVWPAAGAMLITPLPGGGSTIRFTFPDRGIIRSIGTGRVVKLRHVATKRIARQYEIIVRHDDDFESSYSIIDQTPHMRSGDTGPLVPQGDLVESGAELYEIRNGGILHFQLFRGGKLTDPTTYIQADPGSPNRPSGH